MSSYADRDAAAHTHYMAHMMRSTQPPRIRPYMIVIMVLALGMFFIGLTMTIIAFWPGHSSIGQDPMEIAGPILLGLGGVIFIGGMFLMCRRQAKSRKHLERTIAASIQNRSRSFDQTLSQAPSMDAKPQKSILKKTPSTSTYGTGRGSDIEDSGVANTFQTQSYTQSMSYEPDSSGSSGKFEVYRIEALPDPLSARQTGKTRPTSTTSTGSARNGPVEAQPSLTLQSSTDSEATVPVPVRSRTRERRQRTTGNKPAYSNDAYTADPGEPPAAAVGATHGAPMHEDIYEEPLATSEMKPSSQRREMRSYSNEGYDMFDPDNPAPSEAQPQVQPPPVDDELPPQAEKPRKSRHADGTRESGRRKKHRDGSGHRRHRSRDGEGGEPRRRKKKHAASGEEAVQSEGAQPQNGAMNYPGVQASPQMPVRINIKADPGTAVHIHSQAQPPQMQPAVQPYPEPQPPPNLNQTGSSIETEI